VSAPVEGALARGAKALGRPSSQLLRLDPAELAAVAVGMLQVVADELLELVVSVIEPATEPLVQCGARLLRDPLVRSVPDQHVPEAEAVLDCLVWADQLLADEQGELRAAGSPALRRKRSEGLPVELEPDHGGSLDDFELL